MKKEKMTKLNDFNFGHAALELEKITNQLEEGDLDLDEAIAKYEQGARLAVEMKKYLKEAENKITTIRSSLE